MKNYLHTTLSLGLTILGLYFLASILLGLVPASQIINLPWYITRATALTAFGLMFLVVILGTGMTSSYIYKFINPVRAWAIHKYLSLAMTIMILFHIGSLLFDKFIKLSLFNILIPFTTDYQPLFLSLGIFGFYILLATILISIFLRLRMPRFWRLTHYFVYPIFALVFIHSLFIGTDSSSQAMAIVYWLTGIIFVLLLIYRFFIYRVKIK